MKRDQVGQIWRSIFTPLDNLKWHPLIISEHRRAAVEQSTMKLEKAIESYEKTLKRFPKCADGHALYAQVGSRGLLENSDLGVLKLFHTQLN